MKTLTFGCCLVAFWLASGSCFALTDLLTNGNFETEALAPWTVGTGTATVGPAGGNNSACSLSGSIEQTVTFPEEGGFYLSIDILQTGSAPPGQALNIVFIVEKDGVQIVGDVVEVEQNSFRGDHVARNFRGSAGAATVRIGFTGVIDNVRLVELLPVRVAGGYQGSAKITVAASALIDSETIALTTNEKVVARIEPNGRFTIIRGTDVIYGILFDDDTFDLGSQGSRQTGTAQVRGKRIHFKFPYSPDQAGNRLLYDEGHQSVNLHAQIIISLIRVGG